MLARRLLQVAPSDASPASRESDLSRSEAERASGSSSSLARVVAALDGTSGALVVLRADRASVHAIAGHALRWLTHAGARPIIVRSDGALEPWREAAAALGLGAASMGASSSSARASVSAREVATELAAALRRAPTTSLVLADADGPSRAFGATVATELEALLSEQSPAVDSSNDPELARASDASPAFARVVWVVSRASVSTQLPGAERAAVVDAPSELDEADTREWWRLASAFAVPAPARVDTLDRWWRAAVSSSVGSFADPSERLGSLPRASLAVIAVVALAGRPLHPADIAEVLARAGVEHASSESAVRGAAVAARSVGVVCEEGARIGLTESVDADAVVSLAGLRPAELATAVAHLLGRLLPDDPWALARAAELVVAHARHGTTPEDAARASADAFRQAIRLAVDADARADLWDRFVGALQAAGPASSVGVGPLVDLADLALRTGDVEVALRLARSAAAARGDDANVLLVVGRALVATGDIVAGAVTLEQAARVADDDRARSRAWVELAEARYWSSDMAGARVAAERALVLAGAAPEASRSERLDARNVIGKLLLAKGEYAAAEIHFATDACDASIFALPVAELRARVNRAIAVLSLGRRDEAQSLLEAVLDDAEQRGELKAAGLTLVNLAPIAILDHRYGDALEISERAVAVLRRIGDRLALAKCIANLADLRVRMGLVDEAAQALKFGARVFKGPPPREQAAHFAIVSGRVHLAQHDASRAHASVGSALAALGATALGAGHSHGASADGEPSEVVRGPAHELVSQALRVGVRAALEDGDTVRARVLFERAELEHAPARALAELAVLRATIARATGANYDLLAADAIRACREADEDDLVREAYLLAYYAAADVAGHGGEGALALAASSLDAAAYFRDRVAAGLPASLRPRFLGRDDVAQIERERAALAARVAACVPVSEASSDSFARASAPPPVSQGAPSGVARPSSRRIVGSDPAIRSLLHAIGKVGPADATVLIQGESGTGKELVAEAVHAASPRKAGPLVKVNCAALVETLLLSELFGHEKGAFTGAAAKRRGRFEAADGGTLFLDEIGDISSRTQVALLRVLQEKTFERVGGTAPVRANVRIVCATHRDLKAMVARGEFREDLYYRLCGVALQVPALRTRLGDLGPICEAILARIADERGGTVKRLSPRALAALKSHTWPGNVRELDNALRAASLFADGDTLEPEDFSENVESLRGIAEVPAAAPSLVGAVGGSPATLRQGAVDPAGTAVANRSSVPPAASIHEPAASEPGRDEPGIPSATPSDAAYAQVRLGTSLHDMKRLIERECIARALSDASGNITRAATLLGMKRPRLSQLVKQYGLGSDGAEAGWEDGPDGPSEEE